MSKCYIAALAYRRLGFSVIPVRPDKKPFIKWEPYQKQHASEEEIEAWWKKHPNANVGIITGQISGIAVIDLDDVEKARPALSELIPDSLVFPIAQTPSGGEHWYFRCSDDSLTNNARTIPGADLRANGGYVVAAPSIGNNGNAYKWYEGLKPGKVELPVLPQAYIDAVVRASTQAREALYINNNSFNDRDIIKEHVTDSVTLFQKGRRDNDIFRIANQLIKAKTPYHEVRQVLEILAQNCNPPFPAHEVSLKIESALKRADRRELNIMEAVERFISVTDGDFCVTEVVQALQSVTGVTNRDNIRQCIKRLKERGFIEKVGKKDGIYRRINDKCDEIDWLNASDETIDIRFPFGIEQFVDIRPKNIIVVAGAPDSGKTALLLNIVEKNMDRHDIHYFSSEMGANEFKSRLVKFDRPLSSWRFKAKERESNFADVIAPNAINIIDFLEMHEDFWKVGLHIKEIFDKLGKGIAVIALQKNPQQDYGLGGIRSLEKARLYLSLDKGTLKIVKAKNWKCEDKNPNGQTINFKLVGGCKFWKQSEWCRQ